MEIAKMERDGFPDMNGMRGREMSGIQSRGKAPSTLAAKHPDAKQMMQRLAEHWRYMETIQDRAALNHEMLRHQRMLDQMLELMQQ